MEYKDFFEKVSGFLEQAEIHKRRGNNDFNPLLYFFFFIIIHTYILHFKE
ncbi:hypothetical protein NHP164001_14010 [Helicobacter trogontum]|uniref:Uncharacterized protein n=1 Tax=Helicobacter trogontum TaxID=50960 RepID=A0ABQ0D4Y2_9HELI